MTYQNFDILIIGSGLTAASFAIALQNSSFTLGMIETKPWYFQEQLVTDLRSLALSHVSKQIFSGLGIWQSLKEFAMPIKKIHVSDQGHFGFTRIDAKHHRLPALGYVLAMEQLQKLLYEKISQQNNLKIISVENVEKIEFSETAGTICCNAQHIQRLFSAKLVVVADGGQSKIRDLLKITTSLHNYDQVALVANVGLFHEHDYTAYERFTKTGPLALLPFAKQSYALIWSLALKQVDYLLQCNDKEFLHELQQTFGYRLGRFTWVGRRQVFPLYLAWANDLVRNRSVLIGNASHTLHPIAGQGFNLGLRDVAILAELLLNAKDDLNIIALLKTYVQMRQKDHQRIINLTDTLVKLFSNDYIPLTWLRNFGLLGLDFTRGKYIFANETLGYIQPLPQLAIPITE